MKDRSKILAIVHQATSNPGKVGTILRDRGYPLDLCCPATGAELPRNLEPYAGAIVFGGPMSANDEHLPFIRSELDWLPNVLDAEIPFLGICLGAQLLARVLGAEVAPHPEGLAEIGYFPIRFLGTELGADLVLPRAMYHWHQEGFELPAATVKLAEGEMFPNQAFRYAQKVYGFQFHPEITFSIVTHWTRAGSDKLSMPGAQPREEQRRKHALYLREVNRWLSEFLNLWLAPL
ncbi:MAG: glutamine amidotransferase [Cyanobacteriota bacterium]|nr:glutamine amidotransferase [Cyanobacteriota bacterium]